MTILNTNYQSEILDISAMSDGVVLAVTTLNGFIYLFDTINFNQISFQKVSEKPIVFGKYKKKNNDFYLIDYNGMNRLYPQTRTNTETMTTASSSSSECSSDIQSTPSSI